MTRILITTLGLLGLLVLSSPTAEAQQTPATRKKAPRTRQAWGLTWHSDVETGLRRARHDALKRRADPKRLLWVRVLGELEGKT